MATYVTPSRSFSLTSQFEALLDQFDTARIGIDLDFSGIPTGSTIHSAVLYMSHNMSAANIDVFSVNGAAYSSGMGVISQVGGTRTYTFRFKAKGGNSSYTITCQSVRVEVNYTPPGGGGPTPPAPGMPGITAVHLGPGPADYYTSPGAVTTLSWAATADPSNPITGFNVRRRDNDGAWYALVNGATGYNLDVTAMVGGGEWADFEVTAVSAGGNSAPMISARLITRSRVRAPYNCLVSPTSCYPGDPITIYWDDGGDGVGTYKTSYYLYLNDVLIMNTIEKSFVMTAPAAGTHRFHVVTGSYPEGYESLPSPTATLTSLSLRSSGSLNKITVPMDGVSDITLNISAVRSRLRHKAVWYLGSRSVTQDIAAGIGSTTLTVPALWCDRLPNAVSGTASVRLETYDGDAKVGEATYTFGVTVPADVVPALPALTAALVKNNAPADIERYIQNYSSVALAISGEAGAHGSTIEKYRIYGHGYDVDTKTATFGKLAGTGEHTFTAVVTDSRSRTASETVKITVQEYRAPSLSGVEMYRCDVNGVKNSAGTYVRLKATSVFSSIDGQNTATLQGRVYMKGATPSAWQGMTNSVMLVAGGGSLLPMKTYIAEIRIVDKLNTYQIDALIPTETVAFHALDGGLGAAVGKYAERVGAFDIPDDWTTNIDADKLDGKHGAEYLHPANYLDYVYPVGAIYMSLTATSPATLFGGTWAAIAAGTFLVAAGTGYAAGSTGGAASVTLTESQIPGHSHMQRGTFNTTPQGYVTSMVNATLGTEVSGNTSTAYAGGGNSHENRPPYYAVYMWRRTA